MTGVVGGEADGGVVVEAEGDQCILQTAEGLVESFDLSPITTEVVLSAATGLHVGR